MRNVRLAPFTGDDLIYRFCSVAGAAGRAMVPFEALAAQVDALDVERAPLVTLAGSDPLEHPDFPELVARCRARGLTRFRLVTDGYGLASDTVIAFLRDSGIDEVRVVFPTHDPRTYARAMRTRTRFDACAAGLRKAAESGLETHVVVPLTTFAREHADAFLDWLRPLPLSGLLVEAPEVHRVPERFRDALLPYADAARLTAALFAESRRQRRVIGVFERWIVPPCGADGALDDYGDLFNQRYKHYRAHADTPTTRVAACATCDLTSACPGVEPDYLAVYGDAALRPIPLDEANTWYTKPINRLDEIPFKRVSAFDNQERSGKRGLLRINGHCNMGCSFCFVDLSQPNVDVAALTAELDRLAATGVTELVLSGGEPTLHPGLPEVVAHGKRLGFATIELQSNGVRLAHPDYAAQLASAGLDVACLSLHSHDPDVSDRITKRPRAFAKTVQGLHNLRALGVQTRISHVISRLNYRDLPAFVRFARAEFADGPLDICFAIAQEISSQTSTWVLPTFTDIKPFVREALDHCLAHGVTFSGLIGQGSYPPCMLDGDLRYYERALQEVHLSRDTPDWVKPDRCRTCAFDTRCLGVRRSYVATYGDAEIRPF